MREPKSSKYEANLDSRVRGNDDYGRPNFQRIFETAH
jgi:hypothetical protein